MDKNAIKKYAVWARNELIARVSQKAEQYEITGEKTTPASAESINGRLLTAAEKNQRKALIEKIQDDGFEQVMEEVAYTWFNRFTALRFMEVNNYLPSHTRVFTNEAGEFKPQILTDAIHLELEGLDMDKVFELKDANKTEELYKYLLITQCNALSEILPRMFQKIADYTELLLPDYLLREGSVIEQMIALIPEEDWTDQVQIIGWLYQYYNSEPKDKVFADLKKNIKITKENIPAATQLFTPDWIVHYLVENSLGRLWLEGHPNDSLKSEWKYYLDEAEQEPEVQAQLAAIRKEYAALKPEEIRVIDPCMGSGHILCVLFDVLVRIYEDYGYTAREAAVKIVEDNLWGLDIDERAAQMSYFAVMMKARQYDRRFFSRKVQPHVYAIEESNGITSAPMHDMGINLTQEEYTEAVKQAMRLVEEMHDAKEYGSIIHVTPCDWNLLRRFAVPREEGGQLHLDIHGEIEASARLQVLINVGESLSQKYHVVVTNPPYMGSAGMSEKLLDFVKKNYPNGKDDLFSCFIEKIIPWIHKNGFCGLMTSYTWMFLTGASKLRDFVLNKAAIQSLIQPEYHAFFQDANVPICTFVLRAENMNYTGSYIRLNNFYGADIQEIKALEAIDNPACEWRYSIARDMFKKIPGLPFAYWIPKKTIDLFVNTPLMSTIADMKQGLITGDNDRFLRFWHECDLRKISVNAQKPSKWFFYHKGGEYRKWYGNISLVVNWENAGDEIINFRDAKGKQRSRPQNVQYYFKDGFTWTALTVADFNVRYMPSNAIFDAKGSSGFVKDKKYLLYIIALCNSKVAMEFLSFLAPTMDYSAGSIGKVPVIIDDTKNLEISALVKECINISSRDWNAFETSWDFNEHPFIASARWAIRNGEAITIKQAFEDWKGLAEDRFQKLKENEEELNRLFIDIYGFGDELNPEVDDKDVTVRCANLQREVRSLISYAIGCMFGRYSRDTSGLVYAGGVWDTSKYAAFQPDKDAIIPICDDEYFEDDILGHFVKFIEVAFGKETLEENLRFIADALGGKGSSREVIRTYFINDFYADHLKVYQKRPIYWLFDSGKKNGFKCLIYMHRYQPDTIARIRTDYVHEQQSRYRTAIADMEQRISGASTSERVKLSKQLAKLQAQAEEVRVYEEKIHHFADQMISIDLDDGVKHNYEIFKDVLAKIK